MILLRILLSPRLEVTGAPHQVDQASRHVDDTCQAEHHVPLVQSSLCRINYINSVQDENNSYMSGQLTDNDGGQEARYLRHGVCDPKEYTRVRPRHLSVGEVEPA